MELILDTKKRTVTRGGRTIKLSPREMNLLSYFIRNKNNIVDRKNLLINIWNYAPDIDTRVVDVYVGYLRRKIDSGYSKKLIHSVRGLGYLFKE
ncbi:MAG: winged helix-turn-helix domain-containing protein [Candidatus Levyibacteriota bacterium]